MEEQITFPESKEIHFHKNGQKVLALLPAATTKHVVTDDTSLILFGLGTSHKLSEGAKGILEGNFKGNIFLEGTLVMFDQDYQVTLMKYSVSKGFVVISEGDITYNLLASMKQEGLEGKIYFPVTKF